jgi:hypothetical protein
MRLVRCLQQQNIDAKDAQGMPMNTCVLPRHAQEAAHS